MRTASRDGIREFEFRADELKALNKAASILDDMKRYPERFPRAHQAHQETVASIGHIETPPVPFRPGEAPAEPAKGK